MDNPINTAPECPVDRTLRFMRRGRHAGDLLGIGQIKQAVGAEREAVRGYLIKLVARGDVEVHECTNGIFWRVARAHRPDLVAEPEAVDGHFILQRQIMDDRRGLWFDAETFTNSKRAAHALQAARANAQHSANAWGNPGARVQNIRLIAQVQL